ncbi:MAG: ATP-dependent RNA helicase HrpA [Betaproteobacteria bacterium]|nr:MAG: ATP-dependent RNA helicase HrpA [Betaproteobacteria bacterium]
MSAPSSLQQVLTSDADDIADLIARSLIRDRHRLRRRLKDAGNSNARSAVRSAAQKSVERAERRAQRRLRITYPEQLPVSAKRDEIARAIEDNQVVIVCGETGSGKTTQLPKICLELGRGVFGQIGHTQPRRIAARSVANRISQELGTPLGDAVGFQVRFTDKSSSDNLVKLMTDGILLAETQSDRFLNNYDTLIIDEAHERSLNVDFLLGYIKQLLPKRPELKLIITSATIDAEKFSRHFDKAPVIEVSGRLYPVEVIYRPFDEDDEDAHDIDLPEAVVNALDEVAASGASGDVLVFLPGEREIRECAEALRKHPSHTHRSGRWEILPLYSRLSAKEQERVFATGGARRVVLATNVAETSLTVPGIRYVIDSGLARINRYSFRNKVEMLQVERISRASANQRAGRCGRVMNGVCVRLYSEDDFNARAEFTDPEILRSSLASVILRMQALRLGEVAEFPFVDAPAAKAIADGYQLLLELAAVNEQKRLTAVGKQLARLPIDPRIARMIVSAKEFGCLNEILIIASGLSVQDPRERPIDKQDAVTQAHSDFADERSDFLGYVEMWNWFAEAIRHKQSNRKLVQECHARFLSYLRLREWRELHGQLAAMVADMGWRSNEKPARYEEIHRALLSGLLGNIGFKSDDAGVYLGARGIKFVVHPGSGLKKRKPKWLVGAELTETTRLFARCVAQVDAQWIEKLGAHVAKSNYRDPRWSRDAGNVLATEQVTVYGLIVVPRRQVLYGPVDPVVAREFFIRGALVAGDVNSRAPFLKHNRRLIEQVSELEHKSRRHDVLVDESAMFDFFDERVPQDIWSWVDFEKWRRDAERGNPELLFLKRADLMRHSAEQVTVDLYPDSIELAGYQLPLSYRFEPGHVMDGVTMTVPLAALNQIDERRCEWLVPGLLRDKITELIRGLPKGVRKHFVPVPQVVTKVLGSIKPDSRPLVQALVQALHSKTGVEVSTEMLEAVELPNYLRMNFRVIDDRGEEIAMGRDLVSLRKELGVKAMRSFTETAASEFERKGLRRWDFDELPEMMEVERAGGKVVGFPAIVDNGDSVALTLVDTEVEAQRATRAGLRRLLRLSLPEQFKYLSRNLPGLTEMSLRYALLLEDQGSRGDKASVSDRLRDELIEATCDRAFFVDTGADDAGPVRDRKAFEARVAKAKVRLVEVANEICRLTADILAQYAVLRSRLDDERVAAWPRAIADIRNQLALLLAPRFVVTTPFERLRHFPRYLQAIGIRLDKLPSNSDRDANWHQQLARFWQMYTTRVEQDRLRGVSDPKVEDFRWMLEELRVSLWAQQLKTPYPVSFKRLEKYWAQL